jgi:peptidoglycan/xylan/chitin deacetylase (PgdA/CDA1 family)
MNKLTTLLFHDVYLHAPDESGFTGAGADRYKLPLAGFRTQLAAVDRVRFDAPVLVTALRHSNGAVPPFALSVDDGGLSYHAVLAPCLEERGWVGHCLVTTGQIGQPGFLHKQHIRELHEAGHLIGSHSVSHPHPFSGCSPERLLLEWRHSKLDLEDIIGAPVVVGSIPGGSYSREVVLAARDAGLMILMTSEPETRRQLIDGCQVFGRFTLRRDSPADLAGRLVQRGETAQLQEWVAWNAKKVLKKSLGSGYMHLTGWLGKGQNQRV